MTANICGIKNLGKYKKSLREFPVLPFWFPEMKLLFLMSLSSSQESQKRNLHMKRMRKMTMHFTIFCSVKIFWMPSPAPPPSKFLSETSLLPLLFLGDSISKLKLCYLWLHCSFVRAMYYWGKCPRSSPVHFWPRTQKSYMRIFLGFSGMNVFTLPSVHTDFQPYFFNKKNTTNFETISRQYRHWGIFSHNFF